MHKATKCVQLGWVVDQELRSVIASKPFHNIWSSDKEQSERHLPKGGDSSRGTASADKCHPEADEGLDSTENDARRMTMIR